MKTSPISALLVRNLLKLCFSLALIAIGTGAAFAQCPSAKDTGCSDNNLSFPPNETVYVDIDVRIRGTQQETQIRAALDSWNTANQSNGSGVRFDYGGVPTSGPAVNILHVVNGTLTTPAGQPDPSRAANIRYNRFDATAGHAYDATITFNTGGAMATTDPNSPFYGQAYYQPGAAGYNNVFTKKTLHEVGHGMGLCDVPANQIQNGQSVMNTSVADCPNDNCNAQPTSVQPCDNNAVGTVGNYQPPQPLPTPVYGGGGGGGDGDYYGGGGGYYCTPYYWVYYESWDGGQTWELVDVSYAGCW